MRSCVSVRRRTVWLLCLFAVWTLQGGGCGNGGILSASAQSANVTVTPLMSSSVCPFPISVSMLPSTATVYAACDSPLVVSVNQNSATVSTILSNSSLCGQATAVTVNDQSGTIYVVCDDSPSEVLSINVGGGITTLASGGQCVPSLPAILVGQSIAADPSSGIVYAACSNGIISINTANSNSLITAVPTSYCTTPIAVAVNPITSELYGSCQGTANAIIKVWGNSASPNIATIAYSSACPQPTSLAVDESTFYVYAICTGTGSVLLMITQISRVPLLPLGTGTACPTPVGVSAANGVAFVACEGGPSAIIAVMLSGTYSTVVSSSVCSFPKFVHASPSTGEVLFTCGSGSTSLYSVAFPSVPLTLAGVLSGAYFAGAMLSQMGLNGFLQTVPYSTSSTSFTSGISAQLASQSSQSIFRVMPVTCTVPSALCAPGNPIMTPVPGQLYGFISDRNAQQCNSYLQTGRLNIQNGTIQPNTPLLLYCDTPALTGALSFTSNEVFYINPVAVVVNAASGMFVCSYQLQAWLQNSSPLCASAIPGSLTVQSCNNNSASQLWQFYSPQALPLVNVPAPTTADCALCPAGQFYNLVGCSTCQAGSYCAQCQPNTACPAGAVKGFCPAGSSSPAGSSTSAACTACPAGSYNPSAPGVCQQCPAGSYCISGSVNPVACPAGASSLAGSSTAAACTACAAGTYNPSAGGVCQQCPAGSYCVSGSLTPAPCSAAMSSPAGSTSSAACAPCPPGSENPAAGGICEPCVSGSFSLGNATSCMLCPASSYSNQASSSCTPCPANSWSAMGSAQCTSCPAGRGAPLGSYSGAFCCFASNWTGCALASANFASGLLTAINDWNCEGIALSNSNFNPFGNSCGRSQLFQALSDTYSLANQFVQLTQASPCQSYCN